jgi:hypothetical protein
VITSRRRYGAARFSVLDSGSDAGRSDRPAARCSGVRGHEEVPTGGQVEIRPSGNARGGRYRKADAPPATPASGAAGWEPEDWDQRILPALKAAGVTAAQVIDATGLGVNAAYRALQGRQVPNAQHWDALALLASEPQTAEPPVTRLG